MEKTKQYIAGIDSFSAQSLLFLKTNTYFHGRVAITVISHSIKTWREKGKKSKTDTEQ